MEHDPAEIRAGKRRRDETAEELRKAELVRDRLAGLEHLTRSFPQGHPMRERLEDLRISQALGEVDREIEGLWDRILHPRGT